MQKKRLRIVVRGVVQGVGFRPFVFRLASGMGLAGQVANTTAGVVAEIQGDEQSVALFADRLRKQAPPLAVIDSITSEEIPVQDDTKFVIAASAAVGDRPGPVPPDSDVCDACLAECRDPTDRRRHYPFITCTDCGPRYSLIDDIPYDRPRTAMAAFPLCPACQAEYDNPAHRRFHAETTCCPLCGPRLFLTDCSGTTLADAKDSSNAAIVQEAATALKRGLIVAIKGIGGFHLAVDAGNQDAVVRLRQRKNRPDKPLAVMTRDLAAIRRFARLSHGAETWLTSRTKPVVLLEKIENFPLAPAVAPDNRLVGAMLPATPLHDLLLEQTGLAALVMTSGNLSGVPMARENSEALALLSRVADLFLFHDRRIVTRVDDSVIRPGTGFSIIIRRARGFVPLPVLLDHDAGATLALGGMHKATITVTRGREAFVSQHIGELDNLETQQNLTEVTGHLTRLLRVTPDLVVCDLHPDYCSTRLARETGKQRNIPVVAVQHHHAHAVACMAEHSLAGPTIALTLDGSGFGPDGSIWGGEILLAERSRFQRLAHLEQLPLPGGETAAREPWRMAVSCLHHLFGDSIMELPLPLVKNCAADIPLLVAMIQKKINSPATSSCGRIFDAVAALTGLCLKMSFEGQAAMALELAMDRTAKGCYDHAVHETADGPWLLKTSGIIRGVVEDCVSGVAIAVISAKFHRAMALLFCDACLRLARLHGLRNIVCSGGVFQNAPFADMVQKRLTADGRKVFLHEQLPANDGCLSLGQAVAGRAMCRRVTQEAHCKVLG